MVAKLQPPPRMRDLTDTAFPGVIPVNQVPIWNGVAWVTGAPIPGLHAPTHQFLGVDQINIAGLPGISAQLLLHRLNLLNPHAVTLAQLGVTATPAEVNLLDLSIPPVALGQYLRGTGPATAAWAALQIQDDATPTLGGNLNANSAAITNIGSIAFLAFAAVTIAAGAITITQAATSITTQGGAPVDDLDYIHGGSDGMILFIRPSTIGQSIWVRHLIGGLLAADGIYLQSGQDILLDSITKGMFLMCTDIGAGVLKWFDVTMVPAPMITTGDMTIYVDSEAVGDNNGRTWADAFTTIQDAWDSIPTIVSHDVTVVVREPAKDTGTADANILNKLHDTGAFAGVAADWEQRWVYNITTMAWGYVKAWDSVDQLAMGNITNGANLDLFPAGNEAYVILGTPYRETTLDLGGKYVIGSVKLEAEYSYQGACVALFAAAGRISAGAGSFPNAEVGDTAFVLNRTGAGARTIGYDYGTIRDITNIGMGIIETDMLGSVPTAGWDYVIIKTHISGSDKGYTGVGATIDNPVVDGLSVANVTIEGFEFDFGLNCFHLTTCSNWLIERSIYPATGGSPLISGTLWEEIFSTVYFLYAVMDNSSACAIGETYARLRISYAGLNTVIGQPAIVLRDQAYGEFDHCYWDVANRALQVERSTGAYIALSRISAGVNTGIYARYNSTVQIFLIDNLAVVAATDDGRTQLANPGSLDVGSDASYIA